MAYLPDTATLALTFFRIFEGGIAVDDLPWHASIDTGFTTACHSIGALLDLIAMEPWRWESIRTVEVIAPNDGIPNHCGI